MKYHIFNYLVPKNLIARKEYICAVASAKSVQISVNLLSLLFCRSLIHLVQTSVMSLSTATHARHDGLPSPTDQVPYNFRLAPFYKSARSPMTPAQESADGLAKKASTRMFGGPVLDNDSNDTGWSRSYIVEQDGDVPTNSAAFGRIQQICKEKTIAID